MKLLTLNADIDECAVGTSGCDDNAYCTNTIGGNNCTCNTGFIGTGRTCTPGRFLYVIRLNLNSFKPTFEQNLI